MPDFLQPYASSWRTACGRRWFHASCNCSCRVHIDANYAHLRRILFSRGPAWVTVGPDARKWDFENKRLLIKMIATPFVLFFCFRRLPFLLVAVSHTRPRQRTSCEKGAQYLPSSFSRFLRTLGPLKWF